MIQVTYLDQLNWKLVGKNYQLQSVAKTDRNRVVNNIDAHGTYHNSQQRKR